MRALFIIALAPLPPNCDQRAPLSASWLLELAWSIGRRLGVESKVKAALRHPDDLSREWSVEVLEMVLLVGLACHRARST